MRILKTDSVVGRPAKEVRDALRKIDGAHSSAEKIASAFGLSLNLADALIRDLLNEGYLEPTQRNQQRFSLSAKARQLRAAHFTRRISKRKADELVDGLLVRVAAVKTDDHLTHFVGEVRAFGSYLDETTKDFGDVDIAIALVQRRYPGEDWVERCVQRAKDSGRNFKSYIDMVSYGEREVNAILRGGSSYISLHPIATLSNLNCPSRVLFKA